LIATYEQVFRSSPETLLAVYGLVDLILLLAVAGVERGKALLRALGLKQKRKHLGESIMRRTVVNGRGQVTIPAELRKQLGLKPGTRVTWIEESGRLMLARMTLRRIKELQGFLKPKPGEPSAFEESFKERARERHREELKFARYDRGFEKKIAKAGKLMKRYRNTLNALAK
jgi:AbrB family looped-hinge helix DNA binding protein